jgi:hypothetical protein
MVVSIHNYLKGNSVMKHILTATILLFFLASCGIASPSTPDSASTDLTIEAYPLSEAPQAELTQVPLSDTVEGDPLLKHADQRSQIFPVASCEQKVQMGFCATLGSDQLAAWEDYSDPASGLVIVSRNEEEVYRIPVGGASPIPALRGLWVYDEHWMMETVYVNNQQDGNEITSWAVGQITLDGELLNDQYGYDEAFGLQTIHGRPFYFFRKDGTIDANYDGREIPLGYDEIPHYNCCSASTLNPMIAQNMVAFFARRSSDWYYVEIGVFDQP